MATVTPFGKAGRRTARIDRPAVGLQAGELLTFTLTAAGARPAFGFACAHREILSADMVPGHPKADYQWEFTADHRTDVVVLQLAFVAATKYTLRIDRLSAAGQLLDTLRDVDYESQHAEDTARDSLPVDSE
jgi:hypothetical protein